VRAEKQNHHNDLPFTIDDQYSVPPPQKNRIIRINVIIIIRNSKCSANGATSLLIIKNVNSPIKSTNIFIIIVNRCTNTHVIIGQQQSLLIHTHTHTHNRLAGDWRTDGHDIFAVRA